MSTAEIIPRAIFSLRTQVRHNAHYISDFQILYPAGSILIMHNYVEKRQRHIKLFEKSIYLEMITVSPSRKFAAIIQNSEKGQVLVFDMQTLKKRRVLNLPHESTTARFETISFTHDDIYLVAITGDPDWNMVVYNWARGKVSSIIKAIHPGNTATVAQVCCSPVSNGDVCIIGKGLFRLLTMTDTVWRQYGFQKVDQLNVTCGTWLSGDVMLCGTSDGKLFFVENGELKGVFNAFTSVVLSVKDKDEYFPQINSSSLLAVKTMSKEMENQDLTVRTLISFPKGFAFSCGVGYVHLFEKDKSKYRKRNVFIIDDPIVQDLHSADINVVNHLSINVSQDKLLATTNRAQLYMVRLWGPDLNVAPRIPFRHLGEPLHNGSINGLSLCVWKPIFATSGKFDRTIQIWNFETETVQIVKRFPEDVLCIDLHPMGRFQKQKIAIVGLRNHKFVDVGRLIAIEQTKGIPIVKSAQGNLLAAVSENIVEVYSTVMYNNVQTLKGHTGKINRVRWTADNKKLITCGNDGFILIYDMIKGILSGEIHTPGVSYLDIALSSDGKFIYAVGDDGAIKEIVETNIIKVIGMNQNIINNITLSRSNLVMFVSAGSSDVMSVKLPLTDPPDYTLFPYHSTKITQIRISFDDFTLITVSDGGSIILWKLNLAEDKTVAVDKNFMYSNEVLINKAQLEQHILMMKILSQKLYEMEMDQAREMRDTENKYCEKIKEMHENFASIIEELKEKVEETETSQRNQLVTMRKEIDALREKQENEKKTMIDNYTSKLSVEYEKVHCLDILKEETVKNFDKMVNDLIRSKEEETNEIVKLYEEKLLDVDNALKESHEENLKNIEEHEISKQYLEDDTDRELVETKAKYEKILREEKELNGTLKEEAVHMRKKFAEAHKERIDFRVKLEMLQVEQQKLQLNIQAREKDIADLKSEIVERDTALKEKDERIHLLRKRMQELEKYKFVLDYKIKELRNQIDPKDREIRERKEEMCDMETELANLKKMNASLELQVVELKEKINGTEKDVSTYQRLNTTYTATLKQIKIDIYSLFEELADYKKLKDGITRLYHKYNEDEVAATKDQYGDTDAQREFVLQREFLEKTIRALKSTLRKNQQNKPDSRKVLQDNVVLLEELNNIRKQLKETITSVKTLERMIGMKYKRSIAPSEAFGKMQQALKRKEEIKADYQEVIKEAEQETTELSAQIRMHEEKLITLLRDGTET